MLARNIRGWRVISAWRVSQATAARVPGDAYRRGAHHAARASFLNKYRKLEFIEQNAVEGAPRASQPEPLKVRANDLVALAGGLFELLSLQHSNSSVTSSDEPAIL